MEINVKKVSRIFIMGMLAVFLFWMGCESTTSSNVDELLSILREIIIADSTILIDGIGDEGAQTAEYDYESGLSKAVLDTFPYDFRLVRFGRRLSGHPTREVEIEIDGNVAEALVTTTITGNFIVILRDTVNHTIADSTSKPFTQVAKQKIRLRRFRNTSNPRHNWRVVAFSPIIARTGDKLLEITDISIVSDSLSINLANDSEDSLLNHFFDRLELPIFRPFKLYHVELGVNNPDPFFYDPGEGAMVHYGIKRGVMKFRRVLRDDENDDTFEGNFRVRGQGLRMRRLFFDVIDLASIFDEDAPLNSTFWAFPYRVRYRR